MLHGFMFTCTIWRSINALSALKDEGIPFIALDMPYGKKSNCQPKTPNPQQNIALVKEALRKVSGEPNPVLVGASLGGYIALKYATKHPVSGLLLISPVRSHEENLTKKYHEWKLPVHIIYGTKDKVVTLDEMKRLTRKLPNARLKTYQEARHPAYLDNPKRFKADLLELYREAA